MSRNHIQNIKDLVVQTKHQNVKVQELYRPASRMNANGKQMRRAVRCGTIATSSELEYIKMSRNYIQNIKDLVVQTKHQNIKELHSRTM